MIFMERGSFYKKVSAFATMLARYTLIFLGVVYVAGRASLRVC